MRRPRCPFYGFEWVTGLDLLGPLLDDAGDNRCGLMFDLNVPCMREQAGRDVDLNACRIARSFRRLVDNRGAGEAITFYPREHPGGIRYPAWRDEVLAAADGAAQDPTPESGGPSEQTPTAAELDKARRFKNLVAQAMQRGTVKQLKSPSPATPPGTKPGTSAGQPKDPPR